MTVPARLLGLFPYFAAAAGAFPVPPAPGYARDARAADSLSRAGRADSALVRILAAHAGGMPEDSLYWMLSGIAFRKGALDTAMGFNLAIRAPAGAFRDSVLAQRYRLYTAAGLARDAAALRDSLPPGAWEGPRGRGPVRVTARAGSGWFHEENAAAHAPPFGTDLGGYAPSGAEHRLGATLEAPLARAGGSAWSGTFGMQAVKSYAKDSLDARLELTLREEGWLRSGLSFEAALGGGRITGSGWVRDARGEAGWLSLGAGGFTMFTMGAEAERDERGRDRYRTAWLAWYRDGTVATGRGFTVFAGLNAFVSDPLIAAATDSLIYVDDARKPSPTHYTDSTYDSAITASRFTRYQLYSQYKGPREVSSRAPQSFLAFSPQASYTLPLAARLAAEFSLSFSGTWYPEPYRRDVGTLPDAPANAGFRGLARARADGKEYPVVMDNSSGNFEERYGTDPLRREAKTRLEGQGSAQVTLRRAFRGWGTLALSGLATRTASNLGEAAPVWIPEWDFGATLAWNGAWEW